MEGIKKQQCLLRFQLLFTEDGNVVEYSCFHKKKLIKAIGYLPL